MFQIYFKFFNFLEEIEIISYTIILDISINMFHGEKIVLTGKQLKHQSSRNMYYVLCNEILHLSSTILLGRQNESHTMFLQPAKSLEKM